MSREIPILVPRPVEGKMKLRGVNEGGRKRKLRGGSARLRDRPGYVSIRVGSFYPIR